MKGKRASGTTHSRMVMVHPNAAAIDIGSTMHVAAVGADRTSEPVRSFGTFTGDLHRLADWFAELVLRRSSWNDRGPLDYDLRTT